MDRAFRAIRRCDVVALVIDAVDGITQQDFRCCFRLACPPAQPGCLLCNRVLMGPVLDETGTVAVAQQDLFARW